MSVFVRELPNPPFTNISMTLTHFQSHQLNEIQGIQYTYTEWKQEHMMEKNNWTEGTDIFLRLL